MKDEKKNHSRYNSDSSSCSNRDVETESGSIQITLYEDGSAFAILPGEGNFHGEWEIKKKTKSKIEYRFGFESASHSNALHFVLFSNNDAILEPGFLADNIPGYWFYRL